MNILKDNLDMTFFFKRLFFSLNSLQHHLLTLKNSIFRLSHQNDYIQVQMKVRKRVTPTSDKRKILDAI